MTLRRKLLWISVLYFAEGFPFGIAYKVWPVYFRLHGVSLTEIGLMSLLFLPYTLKAAWAPLVDRFAARQTWVAGSELALAAITLVLLTLDPSRTTAALWITLLGFTVASANQDVAIDGYAVDLATGRDTGPINGVRVAAYRVAMVVSGGVILVLADQVSWTVIWAACAVSFVALAGAALASPRVPRERPEAPPGASREVIRYRIGLLSATTLLLLLAALRDWGPLWITLSVISGTLAVASFLDPTMLRWVARREMVPVVLFTLLYKVADSTLGRMVEPFWVDKGLSPTEIGLISTTLGMVLTVAGALSGGWFIKRHGIFQALLWFGIGQCVSNFGYVVVAVWDLPRQSIYVASVVESFTQGLGTAAFLSFLMVLCEKQHGATQFALLTAIFALSRDLFGAVSGLGAEALGYGAYFTLTALLALPGLALLPWIRGRIPTDGAVAESAAGSD
jgi:PAT family beta-lactamase induction signal transducer AmpG